MRLYKNYIEKKNIGVNIMLNIRNRDSRKKIKQGRCTNLFYNYIIVIKV